MIRKAFHASVALFLLVCVLCPFVEMALQSNDSIFLTGNDTESSLAILVLVLGLALAVASVLVVLVPGILERERLVPANRLLKSASSFAIPILELSQPLPLRI